MGFRRAVQIQILLRPPTTINHRYDSGPDGARVEPTMSTFTAAPGATGGQPAWVQNACARGTSEERRNYDSIREATKHLVVPSGAIMEEDAEQDGGNGGVWPIGDQREYKHGDGSYYAVPPGFQLASCSLRLAWNAWLVGFPGNRSATGSAPVRPLRNILQNKLMPSGRVRNSFKDGWKPIMCVMQASVKGLLTTTRVERMDNAFMDETFAIAIGDLRVKRPDLFEGKNEDKSKQWSVATWSRKIRGH